jgi:hypothetical protein
MTVTATANLDNPGGPGSPASPAVTCQVGGRRRETHVVEESR